MRTKLFLISSSSWEDKSILVPAAHSSLSIHYSCLSSLLINTLLRQVGMAMIPSLKIDPCSPRSHYSSLGHIISVWAIHVQHQSIIPDSQRHLVPPNDVTVYNTNDGKVCLWAPPGEMSSFQFLNNNYSLPQCKMTCKKKKRENTSLVNRTIDHRPENMH